VLPVTWETVRLFLHVLAATVWVGGQITLAGLVPGLRRLSPDAPRAVARRFTVIAWPAFAVLVGTGIWNIVALHVSWDSDRGTTLVVKLAVVAVSGVTAFVHSRVRSRPLLAAFGALTALSALGALFLGIVLAG
jgi:putative copper export protein